jgi:hypothetical protein
VPKREYKIRKKIKYENYCLGSFFTQCHSNAFHLHAAIGAINTTVIVFSYHHHQ